LHARRYRTAGTVPTGAFGRVDRRHGNGFLAIKNFIGERQ
jgi:hypothetical protein